MTSPSALWQVNGILAAELPINDRGLAYGDGLFETLRWQPSGCPLWYLHRARLLSGCARLNLPLDDTVLDAQYTQFLATVTQQNSTLEHAIIKLIVTRGQGGRGYVPPHTPSLNIIWQLLPAPAIAKEARQGVGLQVSAVRLAEQPLLAGLKHLNRLEYVLAAQQATEGLQPLLLDNAGHIIETLSHNIFAVEGKNLLTPRLYRAGVKGVLRDFTQTHAPKLGFVFCESDLLLPQLLQAPEVFIGNSVRGYWPVTSLVDDGVQKNWPIGSLCLQLQHHFESYLKNTHDV
ncbi:MAG: aminodeoxychorismate lyase [Marinagarivorans sp.]|nr:aminodeoxychorismate lyase [Marinagarivorans sp.]